MNREELKRPLWKSEEQQHADAVQAYESLMMRTPPNRRIIETKNFVTMIYPHLNEAGVDHYGRIFLHTFDQRVSERMQFENNISRA